MSNGKEELRMAAYSINPCDGGSIMNNSTITQRPKWHFTLVVWGKKKPKCHCGRFTAASQQQMNLDVGDISMSEELNEDRVVTGAAVVV